MIHREAIRERNRTASYSSMKLIKSLVKTAIMDLMYLGWSTETYFPLWKDQRSNQIWTCKADHILFIAAGAFHEQAF